jgi:hypothetical protein
MREYQYCGSSKPEDWRLIALLRSVDGEGMPFEAMPVVRHHARRAASEWRNDQEAAIEIEARLERSGAIIQAPHSTLAGVWMPLGPTAYGLRSDRFRKSDGVSGRALTTAEVRDASRKNSPDRGLR